MPGGRPTKYKKRYCEDVITHMKTGKSLASFAAHIGTHRAVLWDWRQRHEEFNDACNTAIEGALDWWENLAVMVATGKHMDIDENPKSKKFGKPKLPYVNSGMIQFIMRQRFYRDYNRQPAQEIDVNVKPKVTYKTSMTEDGRLVQDILEDVMKEDEKK